MPDPLTDIFGSIHQWLNGPTYTGGPMTAKQWRDLMSGPGAYALQGYQPKASDILPDAPPPAPDMTDQVVMMARLAARRRSMMGEGLESTFISGPLGDMSSVPTNTPSAGGA